MHRAELEANEVQFYSPEAHKDAEALVERMIEEDAWQQQRLFGDEIDVNEQRRTQLGEMHPDKIVMAARRIQHIDFLAAMHGSGFMDEAVLPAELRRRIGNNEDFFCVDTMPQPEEYELSSGSFIMSRERYIQRFAHRYHVIGGVSLYEFKEYDLKEEK